MRVAIIAPPYPLEEAPAPPLGVCYVAAAFESAGCDVRIFDFMVTGYTREKLKARMEEFAPHVVGSTSVTMNFPQAARIIADVKAIDPAAITIMGGPHVTFRAVETLVENPALDMIVVGEGEHTIAELAPCLTDRKAWKNIAGLAFRDNGGIVTTPARELIQDLDSLPPPARHLLPLSRYKALGFPVSIITSRGCPNKCVFCQGRRMVGHKVRYRDTRLVADEIEFLLSLGFERINVADDLFTSNKRRVREVCDAIRQRGLRFGWTAFARVNTVDDETVAIMKEAGCDCISFGIESGNPDMLARIRKGITLDQARKAVAACKKAGVLAHASFMVGLPGETRQTLADSDAFARSLDIIYGYHFLAPFPGTTVYEEIDNYDLEILTRDWSLYDANRPVVRTSQVSAQDQIDHVAKFEAECDAEWQRIRELYEKGTIDPTNKLRVEGERRLGLVYRILTEDLIEAHGKVPAERAKDREAALSLLKDRLVGATGGDPGVMQAALNHFTSKGLLELFPGQEAAFWAWCSNPTRPGMVGGQAR